jgi:hypothetical protein
MMHMLTRDEHLCWICNKVITAKQLMEDKRMSESKKPEPAVGQWWSFDGARSHCVKHRITDRIDEHVWCFGPGYQDSTESILKYGTYYGSSDQPTKEPIGVDGSPPHGTRAWAKSMLEQGKCVRHHSFCSDGHLTPADVGTMRANLDDTPMATGWSEYVEPNSGLSPSIQQAIAVTNAAQSGFAKYGMYAHHYVSQEQRDAFKKAMTEAQDLMIADLAAKMKHQYIKPIDPDTLRRAAEMPGKAPVVPITREEALERWPTAEADPYEDTAELTAPKAENADGSHGEMPRSTKHALIDGVPVILCSGCSNRPLECTCRRRQYGHVWTENDEAGMRRARNIAGAKADLDRGMGGKR